VSPVEVALALKIAHTQGSWEAVDSIIDAIERVYGEIPLSALAVVPSCVEVLKEDDRETVWFPWNPSIGES